MTEPLKIGSKPRCNEPECRRFVRKPYAKCAVCLGKLYARYRAERKKNPPPQPAVKRSAESKRTQRELYARRRELCICTRCGREPARKGLTECAKCAAYWLARKNHLFRERRSRMSPEEIAAELVTRNKKRRDAYRKRRERGLCTRCGKQPSRPDRITCKSCCAYECEWKRNHRRKMLRTPPTERTA